MSKTEQRKATAAEREVKAWALRKAGWSYRLIAEELKVSKAGVHKILHRVLARLNQESEKTADEVRKIELERLDDGLMAIYARVKKGDLGCLDRMLKIMERRAKLLGLDAAQKVESEGSGSFVVKWEE